MFIPQVGNLERIIVHRLARSPFQFLTICPIRGAITHEHLIYVNASQSRTSTQLAINHTHPSSLPPCPLKKHPPLNLLG